jgi:hypothetical protein
MPKYLVTTTIDTYWDAIIEAEDAHEARDRARDNFDQSRDSLRADITVDEVPEDTELSDV